MEKAEHRGAHLSSQIPWKAENRPRQKVRTYLKNNQVKKRARNMALVEKYLSSK
jgi:hypothetical protein